MKLPKIFASEKNLRGGELILNSRIIVKNWILDRTTQISATLYAREYFWVCEALQISTG